MPSEAAQRRRERRDPRLPVADLFDPMSRSSWDQLPPDCRRDHFDKSTMPASIRNVVIEHPSGITAAMRKSGVIPSWTSCALNLRGLPEEMTQELAWLVHREAELGLRIYPISFNRAAAGLRAATQDGGAEARSARSLLQLTPEAWARHVDLARLRGQKIGQVGEQLIHQLRRWQDELVYPYHRGEWWQLDVWNPLLDARVPQRDHEPQGRTVVNFTHLTSPWLREAAKWWLGDTLATGRYTWSSLRSRNDGLKWLQRHINATTATPRAGGRSRRATPLRPSISRPTARLPHHGRTI